MGLKLTWMEIQKFNFLKYIVQQEQSMRLDIFTAMSVFRLRSSGMLHCVIWYLPTTNNALQNF